VVNDHETVSLILDCGELGTGVREVHHCIRPAWWLRRALDHGYAWCPQCETIRPILGVLTRRTFKDECGHPACEVRTKVAVEVGVHNGRLQPFDSTFCDDHLPLYYGTATSE